jgi:hypothetical protein
MAKWGVYAPLLGWLVLSVTGVCCNRVQVVAAELPENLSCVDVCVLR